MPNPKSPEEIMSEAGLFFLDTSPPSIDIDDVRAFLRSSMASLLCYMAQRMPKEEFGYCDACPGWDNAIDDCRTLLLEEARKITDGV